MNEQDMLAVLHGKTDFIGFQFTLGNDGSKHFSFQVKSKSGPMISIPVSDIDAASKTLPDLINQMSQHGIVQGIFDHKDWLGVLP